MGRAAGEISGGRTGRAAEESVALDGDSRAIGAAGGNIVASAASGGMGGCDGLARLDGDSLAKGAAGCNIATSDRIAASGGMGVGAAGGCDGLGDGLDGGSLADGLGGDGGSLVWKGKRCGK